MRITLLRFGFHHDSTVGALFMNGELKAFTMEDERRDVKVPGETCIPAGCYRLKLRTYGGFHERYLQRFGSTWHSGMIEVEDVPNFTNILIHIGNTDDDTAGCILPGHSHNIVRPDFVGASTDAYREIYPPIRDALLSGESVTLDIQEAHV